MALTLDEIQSTTQDTWLPGAVDNFFTGNILMYRLLQKGGMVTGGEKIRQVIYYGGPHGGAFGRNSTFDTTRYEDHNAARFDWALYYEPITYDILDQIQNSGPAAEVDIVMSKLDMAQTAIRDKMADALYGDGTGAAGTLPITGLKAMINSTTSTAYGGITQDDISEWAPGTVTTTSEALTLPVVRTLRRNCKVGDTEKPNLLILTDALFDTYLGLLQPQQRFTDSTTAKVGFTHIEHEGALVVADTKCPSGYMFALNEKYLDFKSHTEMKFLVEPWMRPTNQKKYTTQIIWAGNLTCGRRKAHGLHNNLS